MDETEEGHSKSGGGGPVAFILQRRVLMAAMAAMESSPAGTLAAIRAAKDGARALLRLMEVRVLRRKNKRFVFSFPLHHPNVRRLSGTSARCFAVALAPYAHSRRRAVVGRIPHRVDVEPSTRAHGEAGGGTSHKAGFTANTRRPSRGGGDGISRRASRLGASRTRATIRARLRATRVIVTTHERWRACTKQ